MRPIIVTLLAGVLLMTASCQANETAPSAAPSTEPGLFFPTDPEQQTVFMAALYRGPLVVRDGCVLTGRDDTYSVPIWRNGFTTDRDDAGRLVVRDETGASVAVEGETFEMGGGYVAEFRPQDKVEAQDDQLRRIEDWLGFAIPERCLGPDVYGIWSVGQTSGL